MLSTSAQQLKEVGASLGHEGPDLVNFIRRKQQKLEREDKKKTKKQTKKRKGARSS